MIARIWHGKTKASQLEAYSAFLRERAVPDYSSTKGFKGLSFLHQIKGDEAHFNLITYWENLDVIRNFAGEDLEKAKYYPEDKDFLLEFEEKVQHHEVFEFSR
ncbi:antibiotic biosynthesis monooxygenase [Flavitalea flava]